MRFTSTLAFTQMAPLEWFEGKGADSRSFRAAIRTGGKIATLEEGEFVSAICEVFSVLSVKIDEMPRNDLPDGIRCTFWLDRASIEFYPTLALHLIEPGSIMVGLMTGNLRKEWIRCALLDDGGAKVAFRAAVAAYYRSLVPLVKSGIEAAFVNDPLLKTRFKSWTLEFWDSDRSRLDSITI